MSAFWRHYLEMVLAMFAGMVLLGPITFMALGLHDQMHADGLAVAVAGALGVGVPLAHLRQHDGLEERRLAVDEVAIERQVPRLEAVAEELSDGREHQEVLAVVVPGALRTVLADEAEGAELADALHLDPRRGRHLLDGHLQADRRLARHLLDDGRRGPRSGRGDRRSVRERRALLFLLTQPVADHLERQVLVALHAQDRLQAAHVVVVELPVPRGRALRIDESLGLQEPDLRDRDVGELGLDLDQHLADREVGARRHQTSAA